MYITPHRDALAAAVLDAAQARRRPIARAPRPSAWLTSSVAGSFKPAPECGPALGRRAAVEAAALPCPAWRGGADVGCAEVVEGTAVLVSLHAGAVPGGPRASAGAHGRRCPRGARSPSSRSTRSRATSSCPRARRPAWRRPRCRTRSSRSCAWRTWPARPRPGAARPWRARAVPAIWCACSAPACCGTARVVSDTGCSHSRSAFGPAVLSRLPILQSLLSTAQAASEAVHFATTL